METVTSSVSNAKLSLPKAQSAALLDQCTCLETRKLGPELKQLAKVYARCFSLPPWNEKWTEQQADAVLQGYAKLGAVYSIAKVKQSYRGLAVAYPLKNAAADTRNAFACFALPDDSWYFADFAVDPNFQNFGLGTKTLRALLESLRRMGLFYTPDRPVCVATRTRYDNARAIKVFSTLGFEQCGQADFVTGGVASLRSLFLLRLRPWGVFVPA
jgi:ribosomal protein S18 acetylase RimI-like enzyme